MLTFTILPFHNHFYVYRSLTWLCLKAEQFVPLMEKPRPVTNVWVVLRLIRNVVALTQGILNGACMERWIFKQHVATSLLKPATLNTKSVAWCQQWYTWIKFSTRYKIQQQNHLNFSFDAFTVYTYEVSKLMMQMRDATVRWHWQQFRWNLMGSWGSLKLT